MYVHYIVESGAWREVEEGGDTVKQKVEEEGEGDKENMKPMVNESKGDVGGKGMGVKSEKEDKEARQCTQCSLNVGRVGMFIYSSFSL